MGREWLHWVGGGGRRRSSAGIKQQPERAAAGCMCAVFNLFDLHHHLPLNHHQHPLSPFLPQEEEEEATTTSHKGVEAPRNSLEVEEEQEKTNLNLNLNLPVNIQIKTTATKSRTEDSSSTAAMDSPGTKTPNLVARLMGLDLLPESNSPSFSCSTSKPPSKKTAAFYDDDIAVGARSLPATPRVSSARKSDVDYHHHRLSLQINKENANEEFKNARPPRFRHSFSQDENRSPGHYAKQILRQVKESVGRRVGLDITNTTRDDVRRDQTLLLKLSKKNTTTTTTTTTITTTVNPTKLKILDTNKSPRNSASSDTNPAKPKNIQAAATADQPLNQSSKSERKSTPKSSERALTRNKREDAFVRSPAAKKASMNEKKPKKANEGLLLPPHSSGPTALPVKKDPSPPATKLPQKQAQVSDALSSKRNTQLSSNSSRSYKQLPLHKIFAAAVPESSSGGGGASERRCYVQKILKRAGIIDKLTPLTLGKWHTPSHPLDPSIFYYLELFHPASAAALGRRCNRKLIFQLVDEILAGVLRPHLDFKPFVSPAAGNIEPFALIDDVCEKIEGFPAADCRVLEDIDFLIEKDLRNPALSGYFEEEGERLVREIEGEIVERLVNETVAAAAAIGVRTERHRRWVSRGEVSSRDEMLNWESSTWTTCPRGVYKVEKGVELE